ncbi:hypothetical protein IM697_44250 [Streptomyces ferrugineus]|uniref:Uncharacterized protein n=1 Tax=Streptomyces ferrugineus TaxID=1413221 RepID=A0A7M2SKJ1_9ACTN|nr:hypothetical protein [Streptomyces ferrugineus]QOV36877.1 hypothetical protein IM697_44250 [Streptomyces ferrugineus]
MVGQAGPSEGDVEYAQLVAELAAFRSGPLRGQPSNRALAEAVKVSPTTVGDWLCAARFPQQVDLLLALVHAVRGKAVDARLAEDTAVVRLLDEGRWRRAYRAEAARRAAGTSRAVKAAQGRTALGEMRPGRPLSEVTDPFHLEVHHAIGSPVAGLPPLPAYVPREHDHELADLVTTAISGSSRIAVLVGGSSTGKTRACWEVLDLLREQREPWRLWHPIDPTLPVLAELAHVAPYTVIWLNEAQNYLLAPDQHGEPLAAGLRNLLSAPERAPVLVLATLWPKYWDTLTTRAEPDRHPHARELLDGHKIKVPDAFTAVDLARLTDDTDRDPRLSEAAQHARDGQITQYLAGVPALMDRYEEAPPATKALIHAAMDARRLGAGPKLPLDLLADAAPGYLTDLEWDRTDGDWLLHALEYVSTACKGIPGILTRCHTGAPRNQRRRRDQRAGPGPGAGQGLLYRLADYLDQHGQRSRADLIPPIDFWTATAAHARPADLYVLAHAAQDRGLDRDAAQLLKRATAHGDSRAAQALVRQLHVLYPDDHRPGQWAVAHIALDDPRVAARLLDCLWQADADELVTSLAERAVSRVPLDHPEAVSELLNKLLEMGAHEQSLTLLARDPATHVDLNNPIAVAFLLKSLQRAGAEQQLTRLLARDPAARVCLDNLRTVAALLRALRGIGADEQVTSLAERVAAHAPFEDAPTLAHLLETLQEVGAREQAVALLARDPATHLVVDDLYSAAFLLSVVRKIGVPEQVTSLAERAVASAACEDLRAVARLLVTLRRVGAHEQAAALMARDPARHASLDDTEAVALLLNTLRRAGADEQLTRLLARDPAAHACLGDPRAVALLLENLRRAGADEQLTRLLARDPAAHACLGDPRAVALLLESLREAGADEQVAVLLARDPATHVALGNPLGVAYLLNSLWRVGAGQQVAVLLARDPATNIAIGRDNIMGFVLNTLRKVGARDQIARLAERLPAAGQFTHFIGISDHQERFRFGREADGGPAAPWSWDDLE